MQPAKEFDTAANVAKAIVGMRYEDAESYVESNSFVFSEELASCQYQANRIQYKMQSGIITEAWNR